MLAVVVGRRGALANRIIISSFSACVVEHSFGLKGERAGQIGVVHSVRFVPKRAQLAVCESNRVSLFKVNGAFIRVVGDNQISTSCVDAAFDNNGFLYALDSQLQRICVFEPQVSAKLLRVLGRRGQSACKFKSPSSICFANDHWQLYVLDIMSTRVQVFS